MRIEKILEENEYAIYTVELEPGFYVDVKAFRTGSKLIYVMQNEDGTVVYGGKEGLVAPTCFYNEAVKKTIVDLVAMNEREVATIVDLVAMNEREVAASAPGTECPFCAHLADQKARDEYWHSRERSIDTSDFTEKYTAACISTTYYKDEVRGRSTSHGYALNFCPVCGKAITASANEKHERSITPSVIREDEGTSPRHKELEMIYDMVSPELDPEGFTLFRSAEEILGKIDYSFFPYEDNVGRFEEANGYMLLSYLLVQHAHKLGEANGHKNRWEIVAPCYEQCIDLSIEETPEYIEFVEKMYANTLAKLGIWKSN